MELNRLGKTVVYPTLITQRRSSHPDLLSTSDAIVGVPFGTHGEGMSIGATNQCIVEGILWLHWLFPQLPLIAQWEMEDSPLWQLEGAPKLDLVIGERWDPHIPTYEFFAELRRKRPEMRAPILVAQQDHMRRCVWTAQAQGLYPRVPKLARMPFDPASLHPQARSKWKLRADPRQAGMFEYERFAVAHSAFTGKI